MTKYYFLHFLNKSVLGIFFSCSVATMISDGMSYKETCLAFFFLALGVSAFEIPFGFLADKLGRKPSVLMGLLSNSVGYLILALANEFYIAAMCFVALGNTLISGADVTWFIGEYQNRRKVSDADTVCLNLSMTERASMVFGAFVGPFLMAKSPSLVWGVTSFVAFAAFLMGGFLSETKSSEELTFSNPELLGKNSLISGISFGFFIMLGAGILYGIGEGGKSLVIQPYIMNINAGFIGILTVHQLLCVFFRISGILFYKRFFLKYAKGPHFVMLAALIMSLSQFVALSTNSYPIFITFFGLAIFALGWGQPLTDSIINSLVINQKLKATYFSIHNMFLNLGEAISYLYLSFWLSDETLNLGWTLGAYGFLASAGFFVLLLKLQKKREVIA